MKINKTLLMIGLNQHSRNIFNKTLQRRNRKNKKEKAIKNSKNKEEKNREYEEFILEEKNKAKTRIQNKLEKIINANSYEDSLIKEFYENIKNILLNNKLDSATTIGEIMFNEDIINFELYKEFDTFIQKYCEKYNLTTDIKKYYNLNIQSEKIESTISKLVEIKRNKLALEELMQKEYDKYINCSKYNTIKIIMDKVKNDILISFQRNEINVLEGSKVFIEKLSIELNECYKRLKTIEELKNMQLKSSYLSQIISQLEENIANPTQFKQIENKVINLLADLLISEDKHKDEVQNTKKTIKNNKIN